jgi:hypothetical protein
MKVRVTGDWGISDEEFLDPQMGGRLFFVSSQTGGCIWFYRSIAAAKARFRVGGPNVFTIGNSVFAVAVPSVIVPVWNVVLFPQGRGFWDHVSLESVEPFEFDPRLSPDAISQQPSEQDIVS